MTPASKRPPTPLTPLTPSTPPTPLTPLHGPISLHVERLVIDEALLTPGGERELRYALAEALEQLLPGAAAGPAAAPGNPAFASGRPAFVPRSSALTPGGPALAPGGPVAAGRPGALAAGVAEQVAAHVRAAISGTRSAEGP
jgi:hypothetical protein